MRKNVFGRQFRRDANERKALFKNLLTSLVLEERIKTSEAKAKAIKGAADKLITKAKKGGNEAFLALQPDVSHAAVTKLINDIAPRFATRNGGYTRIVKVGPRVSDNAAMVLMEWVEKPAVKTDAEKKAASSAAKAAKKEKKDKKAKEVKKAAVKVDKKAASNAVKKETSKKATSDVAKKKNTKKEKKK